MVEGDKVGIPEIFNPPVCSFTVHSMYSFDGIGRPSNVWQFTSVMFPTMGSLGENSSEFVSYIRWWHQILNKKNLLTSSWNTQGNLPTVSFSPVHTFLIKIKIFRRQLEQDWLAGKGGKSCDTVPLLGRGERSLGWWPPWTRQWATLPRPCRNIGSTDFKSFYLWDSLMRFSTSGFSEKGENLMRLSL